MDERKTAAMEALLRKVGCVPEDLDTLEPEDRAHILGRAEEVVRSPAYAMVYLGREVAQRLWPAVVL